MSTSTPAIRSSKGRIRNMTTAALIAAMTAALGPLAIPIEPVPVTFQTFCVALAALLLPPGWAAGSMALYVALGAAGLPVFSKGAAGVGVLLGPTGGYLIGFVIGAGVGSLTRLGLRRAGSSRVVADIGAGIMLLVVVYGIGTAWLAYAAHLPLAAAAAAGVAPFVIGDAVKIAVAIAIAESVRSAVLGAD